MPLEDILKGGKDIFNKGVEAVGDIVETAATGISEGASYIADKATDIGETLYNIPYKFGQKINQLGKEYGDSTISKPKTLNEKDKRYIQQIKNESGLEKTTSLIGSLGEAIGSVVPFVKGHISGTDEYEAKEKNSLLKASIEKANTIRQEQFSIHKLNIFRKIMDLKNQFLKEGKDEELAEILANNTLDDSEKILFEKEKKIYNEKISPILDKLQNDIEIQSKDYRDFIKTKGIEPEEKKYDGSLGVSQELSENNRLEIDSLIGPNIFKAGSHYEEKINKVTELFTELDKQRLSVLSETDESKYDEVNGVYSERHAAMKKYYLSQLKNELELNKTLHKKSDEDEREQRAADKAFASLTEKEKRLVVGKKLFDSVESVALNKGQTIDAFKKGDYGKRLYNTLETFIGSVGLGVNALETTIEDVITKDGRTINQDRVSKSIMKADENLLTQMRTFLIYNPGDTAKLAGSFAGAGGVYKGLNALEKTLATTKIRRFTGRVGGAPAKFAFNTLSTAGKSVISGIPINTQLDQTMGEISTDAQEGMNMLTDLFFDMGITSMVGTAKITKHNLLNDFMWGQNAIDRDTAVKSFTETLNTKTGNNLTEKQVKGMLRDDIIPLYQKTLTPEITKDIFTKGQIYDYTTKVLERMDKESLTTLFTPEGIVVNKINPFVGIKQDFENIDSLIGKIETLEGQEKQLYSNAFNQKLVSLSGWVDGKTIETGVKLENVPKDIKEIFRSKIKEVRDIKVKENLEVKTEELKLEIIKLRNQYSKISPNDYKEHIELTNSITGDTIRMKTTDLEKIVEIQKRGDLQTMIREGYIEFDKKTFHGLESKGVNTGYIKKEGVYKFKDNALVFLADNRKMFVDKAETYLKGLGIVDQKIDLDYVKGMQAHLDEVNKNLNIETKRKTTLNSEYGTLSTMLSYELKQILTGKGIRGAGTSKGMVAKQFTELEKIGLTIDQDINFAMQELKNVLGEGRIVKHYLGDSMKTIQKIMEEVGEKDSLFVLAYGTFGDTQKTGEKMYAKYLLPGKKLLDSPIGKYFKPQEADRFNHYTNKFVETLREIFIHSKVKDKIIDFDKGLQYLDALESLDYYKGIVTKKEDGKMIINNTILDNIIDDAYKIIGDARNKIKVKNYIKDFLNHIIKDESLDNRILGIIVKNLTYKLNINYELVIKLVDKGTPKEKMKFLHSLLMSNSQMEALSKKHFGIDEEIYKKYMDNERIKWNLKADYVLGELRGSRDNLELSLKRLTMTTSVREDLKKDLDAIKNKIAIIEKNKLSLTEKGKEVENFSKIYKGDVLEDSVYIAINERLKEIVTGTKQIKNIEDYQKTRIELSKRLAKLTPKESKIIKEVADKAIDAGDKEMISEELKKNQIEENQVVETLGEEPIQVRDLLGIREETFDIIVHPLKTIADVDKDLTISLRANAKTIGIYDKDYTMKNNPLESFIDSGFKVVDEDEEEIAENLLLDALKKQYRTTEQTKQINDVYDLYAENKDFKELIDSMYYTTDNINTQAWSKTKGIYEMSYKNIGYKNFKELLGNLLDDQFGKKIVAREKGELKNIYKELKEDILSKNLKKIYGKFKRIGQKDFIKNYDGTDILAFSLIKDNKGKNISVRKESFFGDDIFITKELNEKLPGIGYIKVNDIKDILKIKIEAVNEKGKTYETTIDTLLNSSVAKVDFENNPNDLKRNGNEYYSHNFDSVTKADVLFKIIAGIKVEDLGFTGKGIASLNEIVSEENIRIIRNKLGLKKSEEIIGTFGDKDTLIKKFDFEKVNKQKLDFQKKQEYITDAYLKALGYVDDKSKQLEADKATKRESAGMSNYSTFDKVDLPVNTYILEEVHDGVDNLYEKINDEENPFNVKEVLEEIGNLEIYRLNKDLLEDFNKGLEGLDENGVRSYITNNIGKDFNDGTSFVNEPLHDLRNIINGLDGNKSAFKDHFTGMLENGERFLGKTLFNRSKAALFDWKEIIMDREYQDTLNVFVGKSSHKLKGGYKKYDDTKEFADRPRFVEINGRRYKIIGEVKGTTTQNFRNASADSFEEKELQSVALQILNGLPVNIQDKLSLVIKKEIDVLYETHINDKIVNREFDIEGFKKKSEYEILDIVARYKEEGFEDFGFTDSVLGSYLNKFLNSVDIAINKGGTLGESSYMQEVSPYLKRNEIIISRDNEMYTKLQKDLVDQINLVKDPELKKQLKEKLENEDFETIGYRYPSVTKYNLGVYKVRIAENLEKDKSNRGKELHKRFSNIDKGNVVMSPYAVFIKKEGDFDGDHLYMISPYTDKGRLIAQGALNDGTLEMGTEYLDLIKDPKNRHITTSQVDDPVLKQGEIKIDKLVEEAEKKIATLYGTGMIALTAKKSVGLVAAGVRTIRIFRNMYDKSEKLKSLKHNNAYDFYLNTVIYREQNLKGGEDIITIQDIIELFDGSKVSKFSEKGFDTFSADIIQMAVDFAKSGKDEFPTDWVEKLFESVGLNYGNISIEKYTQMSTSYKKHNKITAGDIFSINNNKNNIQENKEKLLSGMIGIKRDLYDYVFNKYGKSLQKLNNYNGLTFFNKQIENINIDVFNKINELDKNKIGYLSNTKKEELKGYLDSKNITNDFIEEYKALGNMKTYQKLDTIATKFPNLFDIENRNDRYLLSIYAYANKDDVIYDLLTAEDKLDFIKMSSELNLERIHKDNFKHYNQALKNTYESVSKTNESLKNKINEPIAEPKVKTKIEVLEVKKEELIEIKNDTIFNNEKSSLEKEIADIDKQIANIRKEEEFNKINNQDIEKSIKDLKKDYLIDYNNEYISHITYENNQTRDMLFNSIDQASSYIVNKNKYLKFMMSDILEQYDGEFLDRYNMISSNVNELGGIDLMAEFVNVENKLKKYGKKEIGLSYKEVNDLRKNIDEIIISKINWLSGVNNIEITTDEIIKLLPSKYENKTTLEVKDFSNRNKLKDEIQTYIDNVAKPLLEIGNQLEKVSAGSIGEISLLKGYSGRGVNTLFKDIRESSKSDGTFTYRTLGLPDKKDLVDRFISKGMSEKHARQVAGLIVPKTGSVEKIIGIFNTFHYLTNYGMLGLVKGHTMGLAQLVPNAVQIRAVINKYGTELDEADLFIKKNRLTGSEDMLRLSVAYDTETANHTIMQGISKMIIATSDTITKWIGKDYKKYGKYVEAALTSPLSVWDMPLEGIRKRAALVQFANTIGLKSIKELDDWYYKMLSSGSSEFDIKAFIESGIRKHYANSGGGVVSSSQIYRKTVLNTFDFDGKEGMMWYLPRAVVALVGYLNGWAFNLAAQFIDNELKSFYAVGHLAKGDFKTSKTYLMDWLSYNKSVMNMSLNAVGLYMKAQKYETERNDIPDKQEFINSFNNSLVSLEILFGQLSGRSEIANRMGGNFEQVMGYTTAGLLERYLRSIIYPSKILGNMYDEYVTSIDSENNLGVVGNFVKGLAIFDKALTSNTDSFLRFNGIKAMNDQYDTMTDKSNVAIFGLGGDTAEDEIFNYQFNNQNFIYYQKDGFWGSLYNIFANPLGRGERGITGTTYDRVNEIIEMLEGREGISLIVNNKGIGVDGYDISRILGKELELTEDNQLATDDLWKHMVFKYSDELDSKGRTLYKYGDTDVKDKYKAGLKTSKIDDIVTIVLRAELEKEGINLDDVLSTKTNDGKGFLKLVALAEKTEGISASQVMGYVLNNKYYERLKEFQKNNLERGQNGVYHQTEYDELAIKQSLLKEYQGYMNLDAMTVGKVLELEVKHNNKDIYEIFDEDKQRSNELNSRNKKIINEMNRQMALNYISTKELQKGNTFVEGLTSRYSTLLSGVDGTPEQIAKMTNRLLVEINNSAQEPKVKLAKQASLILGMNKASYGLIQDDEKFNKLSLESKKLITNWIYDTSIKALDYDPKTMIKDILGSAYGGHGGYGRGYGGGYGGKYYPNRLLNNGNKGNFGGGRPGFSKQFEPMQKLIQNKLPYISHEPSGYLGQINSIPRNYINIFKIPIVKEYNNIKVEILMNELYSKGIIKAGGKENVIAKQHKKNIILKPKRKIKTFKKKFISQSTKTSKGLLPDKPFNYE